MPSDQYGGGMTGFGGVDTDRSALVPPGEKVVNMVPRMVNGPRVQQPYGGGALSYSVPQIEWVEVISYLPPLPDNTGLGDMKGVGPQDAVSADMSLSISGGLKIDVNRVAEGVFGLAQSASKISIGLAIITASGAGEMLSGGVATLPAIGGFFAGGTLIADGWFQASVSIAILFSSIGASPADTGASKGSVVPKSLSHAFGIAGDAFFSVITNKQSTWMERLGEWIGSQPPGVVDFLFFYPTSAY